MAETFAITIHPSARDSADLTVADAMRQVLDILELVEKADELDGGGEVRIVWRLKHASTNSPFTVHAESWSSDPSVSVEIRAARVKRTVQQSMAQLLKLGHCPEWMDAPTLRITKRIFERNLNGIGRTDLDFLEDEDPILILPQEAQYGALTVEKALLDEKLAAPNLTRTEYGSVEGEIVAATRYYSHPALLLRERLTGDRINCVLSDDAANQIGPEHSWMDVWAGQRVLVGGALHYSAEGRITKIDADLVERVAELHIDLNEIRALNLTGGLSPIEYLKLIRGDDHG